MKQSTLGSCIRALRIQNNMTQLQLADKLGVTDKAVSKWERDLSYPDISLFPAIADVLGTTIDGLLRECKEACHPSKLLQAFEMTRDIRMPLHIILGCVEIIRNNHDDLETLQKYLDEIKVSGEYMMSLLNRIFNERDCCSRQDVCCDGYSVSPDNIEKYLQERIAAGQMTKQSFQFKGKRILVAEDMEINREIAAEILKQTGVYTEFAENGLVCLQMLEDAPTGYYDMILMDIMMPHMDGLEATRRIRQLPNQRKADIPIIAMTTSVTEKDRREALAAGMDDFAEKPIFVDKLFSTIARFLHQAESVEHMEEKHEASDNA